MIFSESLSLLGSALQTELPKSFINFTDTCAGMLEGNFLTNCGLNDNFILNSLYIFNLITGGYLPLVFWGVIVGASYLKYHNFVMSGMISAIIFSSTMIFFPTPAEQFFTLLMATGIAVSVFIMIWKIPRD